MPKKLLVINPSQFGYHIDSYYYCKYLKNDYKIIYICWNSNLQKINMQNVRVVYVGRGGNMVVRTLRFLRYALKELSFNPTFVIIKEFKTISSILKICKPSLCFVLDIRSGSVVSNPIRRLLGDFRLVIEAKFFRNITVISEGLAERLHISHKAHVLPLGADTISDKNKVFNKFDLLYVGTLENRHINITIEGLKKFVDEFSHKIPVTYTIIGDGPNNEADELKNVIEEYNLGKLVTVTGRLLHSQLKEYFDRSNIGVSYIPLANCFDCQPPTKTFEYLLSGMPVIATRSTENLKIVRSDTGVLIEDQPKDFYEGLKTLYENKNIFDSKTIRKLNLKHTWKNIVRNNLKIYLDGLTP